MQKIVHNLLEYLRRPEGLAAVALLIQAAIFGIHALILRGHAKTLERNVEIADMQAKTADSMSQALQQQSKIMSDQTKIMEAQFKFQRRVEAKTERQAVFDQTMSVRVALMYLLSVMTSEAPRMHEHIDKEKRAWADLLAAVVACQRALVTSIHLSSAEKQYFTEYTNDVGGLKEGTDLRKSIQDAKAIDEKYRDFAQMLLRVAQAPDNL